MAEPRFYFGIDLEQIGLNDYAVDSWNVERAKSSKIKIYPTSFETIIKKTKERSLDQTIYEVFSTLFFSELMKDYNSIFNSNRNSEIDFKLYSPPSIRLEYGDLDDEKSRVSRIYQLFCPGKPFNKITNDKEKTFFVDNESVRASERTTYLGGIISEIFLREGIVHGDPNLRHFFLLPRVGQVSDIVNVDVCYQYKSENGIGVIDVEGARLLSPYSSEVVKDSDKFKNRILSKFSSNRSEEFFDKGVEKIRRLAENYTLNDRSSTLYESALQAFHRRFIHSRVESIDMDKIRVKYK